jgi:hypothetical protein
MNYRHDDKPPVPIHCLCNGMAVNMHAEIRLLYGLLCDTLKLVAHYVDGQEWDEIDSIQMAEDAIERTLKKEEVR